MNTGKAVSINSDLVYLDFADRADRILNDFVKTGCRDYASANTDRENLVREIRNAYDSKLLDQPLYQDLLCIMAELWNLLYFNRFKDRC